MTWDFDLITISAHSSEIKLFGIAKLTGRFGVSFVSAGQVISLQCLGDLDFREHIREGGLLQGETLRVGFRMLDPIWIFFLLAVIEATSIVASSVRGPEFLARNALAMRPTRERLAWRSGIEVETWARY
jgi:hypothetical protein